MKKILLLSLPLFFPLLFVLFHLFPFVFPLFVLILLIVFLKKNFSRITSISSKQASPYLITLVSSLLFLFLSLLYIKAESHRLNSFFLLEQNPRPFFTTKLQPRVYSSSNFVFPLYLNQNLVSVNLTKVDLSYDPTYLSFQYLNQDSLQDVSIYSSSCNPKTGLLTLVIAPKAKKFSLPQTKLVSIHFKALTPGLTKVSLLPSSKIYQASTEPRNLYLFKTVSFNIPIYPSQEAPSPEADLSPDEVIFVSSNENLTIPPYSVPVRLTFLTIIESLDELILTLYNLPL